MTITRRPLRDNRGRWTRLPWGLYNLIIRPFRVPRERLFAKETARARESHYHRQRPGRLGLRDLYGPGVARTALVRGCHHGREPSGGHPSDGSVSPDHRSGKLPRLSRGQPRSLSGRLDRQEDTADHGPAFRRGRRRAGTARTDETTGRQLRNPSDYRRYRGRRFHRATVYGDHLERRNARGTCRRRGLRGPGQLSRLALGRGVQEPGRQCLCRMRRGAAAIPQ